VWIGGMRFEVALLEMLGGSKVIGIDVFIPPDWRQRPSSHGKLPECLVLIEGSSASGDTFSQLKELLLVSR